MTMNSLSLHSPDYKSSSFNKRRYDLYQGLPGGIRGEEPSSQYRRHKRHGFNPWVGKIPGRRHGNPLQYSSLENPMDREAWWATVQRVTQNWTQLNWLSMQTHVFSQGTSKILPLPLTNANFQLRYKWTRKKFAPSPEQSWSGWTGDCIPCMWHHKVGAQSY